MGNKKGKKVAKAVRQPDAERFTTTYTASDPAFAAWWFGTDNASEPVSASTALGLSAALRAVMIISGTIASLPLRTYQRDGDDRHRIESVFDDPYSGVDGMTSFEWVETVLLHDVLWRNAYLWHEERDRLGDITRYRPLYPEIITKVERVNGKKRYTYNDGADTKTVGSDWITHIPGPSVNGVVGFSVLQACRRIFSGAISGDKAASTTLSQGIRLAGLLTPADDESGIEQAEGEAILKQLRPSLVGEENAGGIAFINRDLKLQPWTPTNVESQWHETRTEILGEIGRIFGVPPHLLGDTEKQTSWGSGVAEQNLGLARYTLMPWSTRLEQRLTQRLPRGQFVEFDYKGLLQGTPAEEIALLLEQKAADILDVDEVRKILNLPPLTAAQKTAMAPAPPPVQPPVQIPAVAASVVHEPDRFADLRQYVELQNGQLAAALAARDGGVNFAAGAIQVTTPDVHVEAGTTFAPGAIAVTTPDVRVDAPVTIAEGALQVATTVEDGAVRVDTTVHTPDVTVVEPPQPTRTVIDRDDEGVITGSHEEPA